MTVGERIKTLRTSAKMSQVELAHEIGVTKQTIYKYENNIITNIPLDKLNAISVIFDVSPSYFWEPIDYAVTIGDTKCYIESQRSANYSNLNQRINMFSKFLCNNPEYCDLFEEIQKINKNDISLIIQLIQKMTH